MAQAYFSLVTTNGKIKLAQSAAGGDPVVITHFAIGDGNGAETNPTAASAALVREVWRTPVESVVTDPDNPSAILVTAIIPTNAGGWWMREFGIFDQTGSMIAVAKPVSQYKPTALEGQLEDIRYEFQIIIGENANVTLLVDPSLLFATRAWVENRKIPMGQLMRLPWLPVVSMTLSSAPGNPVVGDTYLVPSNATGIWAANIGKIAEWNGSSWNYIAPPDGHGVSLQDGRIFERVGGSYIEKTALDAQSGKWISATDTGALNALSITLAPAPASRPAYLIVRPSSTNTGPVSLTIVGFASVSILRRGGAALVPGDLAANVPAALVWNGTAYELLNPVVPVPGTGFSGRRSNQGWLPATAATSTLTATFTAPSTGVVIVFSTVNKSYSGGSNPNIANVALINGVAGASDLVNLSTTSITSSLVLAGASVTVSSSVTVESAPTVNLSQYLNYIFIPA